MQNPFIARWSAAGHTLCLGHWQISYLDQAIVLPDKIANHDMNTRGNFSWMFPDEAEFIEGLGFEDWLEDNVEWLSDVFIQHDIPLDAEHFLHFYQAVNSEDWRCSSCGGCI